MKLDASSSTGAGWRSSLMLLVAAGWGVGGLGYAVAQAHDADRNEQIAGLEAPSDAKAAPAAASEIRAHRDDENGSDVRVVAPDVMPRLRRDAHVKLVSQQAARTPASSDDIIPAAQTLPSQSEASPLPPVNQIDQPETLQPPLFDTPQLTADVRPFEPITDVSVDIALPPGLAPGVDSATRELQPDFWDVRLAGGWPIFDFTWAPTNVRHRPLYFEQANLERYGYSIAGPCIQPFISGAHFFAVIPALPYKMTVECPNDCIYTLGSYRPGTCGVPRRWILPPWSWPAASVEAGAAAGLVLLIP